MRWASLLSLTVFAVTTGSAPASAVEWRRFVIPQTGASVDIPISIFSEAGEQPKGGVGRAFVTADRRADLTVQSIRTDDSPPVFLAKRNPPRGIEYKRVTPKFFAVFERARGSTWYNRCNKSGAFLNCVLINYPRAEERQWDNVVTRISLTLSKKCASRERKGSDASTHIGAIELNICSGKFLWSSGNESLFKNVYESME